MNKKPTVKEFLAYAKEAGLEEDFTRIDLRTGKRALFNEETLQRWIDQGYEEPDAE